jgi:hypothetical protein
MGWLSGLGDWIGDTWVDTTDAIGDAAVDTVDWFGDTAADVGDAIGDAYNKITDWVYDALEDAKNWMIEQLLALTEEIRVWKYKFSIWLGEWLDNPILFWLTIAGLTVAVIYLPSVIASLQSTTVWVAAKAAFDVVKKMTGTFLDKIHYIQALTVHRIWLIIDVDYQEFWNSLDQAFMGLAEQASLGVGTLNALTENIHALYFSTYTMMGWDVDSIEVKFYQDSTAFWAKANKRWERYVRDPQLIFLDIQQELVYPILQEQALNGEERAKSELETAQKIDTTITNVDTVRKDLNALIEMLPQSVQDAIDKNTLQVLNKVNEIFEEYIEPYQLKLQESMSIVSQNIYEIEEAVALNRLRKRTPGDELINILFDGSLDIASKRKAMSYLLSLIFDGDMSTNDDVIGIVSRQNTVADDDLAPLQKIYPSEVYQPLVTIKLADIQPPKGGWFVGEY